MKNHIFILALLCLLVGIRLTSWAQTQSLNKKVSLNIGEKNWGEIFKELEQQTGFNFGYSPQNFKEQPASQNFSSEKLEDVLNKLLQPLGMSWKVQSAMIIIFKDNSKTKNGKARNNHHSNGKATLNGYVRMKGSGEALIGATIIVKGTTTGTITNPYGFFALTLPQGEYTLQCFYIGFHNREYEINLLNDQSLSIELEEQQVELEEVVVEYKETATERIQIPQMGKESLTVQTLKKIPTLAGESDVLKAIQLTPGVLTQGEGSSNLFVRGGNGDQNLILLDEAPVYNPSHLMGFFSVFNSDALKDLSFYRGGIPSNYGGRLSSVLNINMKEGNNQRLSASGGIGTLASRITLEGPIQKGKSSFIVSGRRTYADLFLKASADEFTRQTSVYFYDLNAKFNVKLGEKDRIYFSGYFGRDVNKVRSLQYAIDWGNTTATTRWNHLFSNKLFSNTTLIYSNYNYLIDLSAATSPVSWKSTIRDISLKEDLSWYASPKHLVNFGLQSTWHELNPGFSADETATTEAIGIDPVPESRALEHAFYISDEFQVSDKLRLNYGLRYSLFQLIATGELIIYGPNVAPQVFEPESTGGIYKSFGGFEPRFSMSYQLNGNSSVKMSYQRTRQYLHMLSNTNLSFNVFDIWLPASTQTPPQIADQVAVGYYRTFNKGVWEFSSELYGKKMQNQIEYRDHSRLIMNRFLEGELLNGDADAYGLELQLRKNEGRLKGWLNYTYSRVFRKISELEIGERFPANYDQPHNLQAALQFKLSPRVEIAANWTFQSGRPITLPISTIQFEGRNAPIYGDRNTTRLPDFHRLDVSVTLNRLPKANRKNDSNWVFGLYNAYNRLNAATAFVSAELEDIDLIADASKTGYYKLAMFGLLPSVTYNFKF